LTVPPASSVAFATGDTIKVINLHSTALTIAGGSGVTVNAAAGLTLSQYQSAEIILTATSNSWVLAESAVTATASGGLEPASPLLLMGG
jgi:hypothetical protein